MPSIIGCLRGAATVLAALALVTVPGAARAQAAYPSGPVKVLVGFTAGSGPDVLARTVAAQLSLDLGQQFYVENQGGANGTLAIGTLVRSEPNGQTLLYSSASIAPIPHMMKSLRFDIRRDLEPIATIGQLDGLLMLVHPSTPVKTITEFVAYAKSNRVVFGSPGVGNTLHLVAELFKVRTGVRMDHVPFRGAGDVANALLSQSIGTMFVTPPSVLGLAKDGQLRAIGYTGSKPYAELPGLEPMKDAVPGFPVWGSWGMIYAPAGTPEPLIAKLNAAIRKAVRVPAAAQVLQQAGYFPDELSPAETKALFLREIDAAGEAVKAAGIEPG